MKSVPQTPKRVVLYARVSTDEQDKKDGTNYQRPELTQWTSPARLGASPTRLGG
jgi:predicted site-specific integrase-resolvase